jgi:O-antigen ligase
VSEVNCGVSERTCDQSNYSQSQAQQRQRGGLRHVILMIALVAMARTILFTAWLLITTVFLAAVIKIMMLLKIFTNNLLVKLILVILRPIIFLFLFILILIARPIMLLLAAIIRINDTDMSLT